MKQPSLTTPVPSMKPLVPDHLSGRWLRRALGALLFFAVGGTVPCALAVDVPLAFRNPGMEEGTGAPAAWRQGAPVAGVQLLWDHETAHGGKASLCLKKTAQRYFPIAQWSQSLPVESASTPRKLRVTCWVKAEAVTKAIIDVPYQDAGGKQGHTWAVFLGQKQNTDPALTHDWKPYEVVVEVPSNTSRVGVSFQIYGPGNVWFDDLQVAWVRQ